MTAVKSGATPEPVVIEMIESGLPAPEPASSDGGDPPEEQRRAGLAALESRPFKAFWLSLILSLTGLWVRITALGYLVYDLTDDELLLGIVGFANAAPVLIASPIAGAVLDNFDRRKVLIAVQTSLMITAVILAILVGSGAVQVWHLLAISVANGFASGFDWPARFAIVPALVPRRDLPSAVALNSAAFNASRIVGPAIAGVTISAIGVAACFGMNAVLYLPFVVVLLTMAADQVRPSGAVASTVSADGVIVPAPKRTVRGAISDLGDGYRYIWRTPTIRALLSVDIIPLAFGLTYFQLAPAIARDVLDLGSRGLGLLLTFSGVGTLLGVTCVAMFGAIHRRGRVVIIGVAAFAIAVIAFGASSNAYLSFGLILILGVCSSIYATFNDTLLQTLVDDRYRGRVMSVYSMFWGLTPIGGLLGGVLARQFNVQWAVMINGMIVLLFVPVLFRWTPVRHID